MIYANTSLFFSSFSFFGIIFFFDLYLAFWEGVVVLKDRGFEEGGGVLGAHLQMHLKREGVCHVPLQLAPPMKNGKGIA